MVPKMMLGVKQDQGIASTRYIPQNKTATKMSTVLDPPK